MKQWICYRNFKLPKIAGLGTWKPYEQLHEVSSEVSFTYDIGIGEGTSSTDKRVIGQITAATQVEIDAVLDHINVFSPKKLTVTQAHDALEEITGWTVTINGENLEYTTDGTDYVR